MIEKPPCAQEVSAYTDTLTDSLVIVIFARIWSIGLV